MALLDVSPLARDIQTAIHQKFSPAERLASAIEMSDFARRLVESGIRARKPGRTDDEIRQMVIKTLYGSRTDQK